MQFKVIWYSKLTKMSYSHNSDEKLGLTDNFYSKDHTLN